jgi:hypothetical protein
VLAGVLVASLAGGDRAAAATPAPTFVRTDYPELGSNHVVADFHGDGRPDLAGLGPQSAAVLLATGVGTFGARVDS